MIQEVVNTMLYSRFSAMSDGKMLNGKAQMEYYYDKYKIVKSDVLKKAIEWNKKR